MRITSTQAEILAGRVLDKLLKENTYVSPEQIAKLKIFVSRRAQIEKTIKNAQKVLADHDRQLIAITGQGAFNRCYNKGNVNSIVETIRKHNTPTLTGIKEEIIVGNMFDEDIDLETFLEAVASKFRPRKASKSKKSKS